MKLSIVVVAVTFVAAVQGVTYKLNDCILVDVTGSLTMDAVENGTSFANKTIELVAVDPSAITGTCSNDTGSSASMVVKFSNSIEWALYFNVDSDGNVELDQLLSFNASEVFISNALPTDTVSMTDRGNITLSPKNESYRCDAEQTFPFDLNSNTTDNMFTYTVTQTIRDLKAQAFGLDNGTYSTSVKDCDADTNSTTEPTTVATTEPTTAPAAPTTPAVPTVNPVKPVMFVVNDSLGVACFRLEAGLQFAVDYNTTNNTMEFSKVRVVDNTTTVVTGTCGNETATMVITGSDYQLEITETLTNISASSKISLNVTLDAENFPDAADVNKTVMYESMTQNFNQSKLNTFYMCDSEQTVTLGSSRTTLYADQVRLQAFNLNNGEFTGAGEGCALDPTPSPSTPAPVPSDNLYSVTDGKNTCIVLKGDISFSNISYLQRNVTVFAKPINIPAYNASNPDVKVTGTCGNITQEINITFNGNWSLSMVFARGSSEDSAMLGASQDEYFVQDITFTYDLRPEFFPNTSNPGDVRTASQRNMTDDLWKGQVGGGSYKCDADITTSLSEGVQLDTSNLQYKAFNKGNDTTFGDNVSECPADDESNSIVPIAVGAALAGLVVIVLIAYLIGRRRSRRQGYESV